MNASLRPKISENLDQIIRNPVPAPSASSPLDEVWQEGEKQGGRGGRLTNISQQICLQDPTILTPTPEIIRDGDETRAHDCDLHVYEEETDADPNNLSNSPFTLHPKTLKARIVGEGRGEGWRTKEPSNKTAHR
jgi:hypothetical protein